MSGIDLASIPPRALAEGQRCQVWIQRVAGGDPVLLFETAELLLEAPNWLPDAEGAPGDLLLNGDGGLFRLTRAGELAPVPLAGVRNLNNDHVLHPDGAEVFVSSMDGHLYRVPVTGGEAARVTTSAPDGLWHFLHGVSPDGSRLAFVGVDVTADDWTGVITTVGADGTGYHVLLDGPGSSDGCEYTPDGAWLHVNTEAFDGHAQIGRLRPDGTELTQLTFDDRVNWFPHVSPDGATWVYLSYPPGTEGHPADLHVELKLVRDGDWAAATVIADIPVGGQGTINVNSWAPDSSAFAYVTYPFASA